MHCAHNSHVVSEKCIFLSHLSKRYAPEQALASYIFYFSILKWKVKNNHALRAGKEQHHQHSICKSVFSWNALRFWWFAIHNKVQWRPLYKAEAAIQISNLTLHSIKFAVSDERMAESKNVLTSKTDAIYYRPRGSSIAIFSEKNTFFPSPYNTSTRDVLLRALKLDG